MPMFKLPAIAQPSFDPTKVHGEDVLLKTEAAKRPEEGEVRVRALDHFLFERNGEFVYPTLGKPESWWKGVVVYGYIAALTGPARFLVWAGQWNVDWEGLYIQPRRLGNIVGLTKETHQHWRNGAEHILWLETEFASYALLSPTDEYDEGDVWKETVETYRELPNGSQADPAFQTVDPDDDRPYWWNSSGNQSWNKLTEPVRKEERQEKKRQRERERQKREEEAAERKRAAGGNKKETGRRRSSVGGKPPKKPRSSGVGAGGARPSVGGKSPRSSAVGAGGAGPSAKGKRKLEADPATSEPENSRKSRKIETSSSLDGEESSGPEVSSDVPDGHLPAAEPGRGSVPEASAVPQPADPVVPKAVAASDPPDASNEEVAGGQPRGEVGAKSPAAEEKGETKTAQIGGTPPIAAVEERQGSERETTVPAEPAKRPSISPELRLTEVLLQLAKEAGESEKPDRGTALEGLQQSGDSGGACTPSVPISIDVECAVVAPSAGSQLAKGLQDVFLGMLSQESAPASAEPGPVVDASRGIEDLDITMADVATAPAAPTPPAPTTVAAPPSLTGHAPETQEVVAVEVSGNDESRAEGPPPLEAANTPVAEFGRILAEEGVPTDPVLHEPAPQEPAPPAHAPPVTSIAALVHQAPSGPTRAVSGDGEPPSTSGHSIAPVEPAALPEDLDLDNRSSRLRRSAGVPAKPPA
ncbi:hypothetical protein FRC09_009792 [Ceratobasidium sp. 395]|nr:hypothetical protein FRC09_009792 [Ceratobasidium sp. 395]